MGSSYCFSFSHGKKLFQIFAYSSTFPTSFNHFFTFTLLLLLCSFYFPLSHTPSLFSTSVHHINAIYCTILFHSLSDLLHSFSLPFSSLPLPSFSCLSFPSFSYNFSFSSCFYRLSIQVIFNLLQWRNFLKTSMLWTMITYLLELLVTLVFMILVSTSSVPFMQYTSNCIVNFLTYLLIHFYIHYVHIHTHNSLALTYTLTLTQFMSQISDFLS